MKESDLIEIGIDRARIQKKCGKCLSGLSKSIHTTKEKLETVPGRFVLIDTKSLNDEMRSLDPTKNESVEGLVLLIARSVEEFKGYRFNESSIEAIKEQIIEDAMHNDVPAFCHDSISREVLYNGIVIGKYIE
jgi:hypothetical protein